jgi:hypothetical protein
MLFEISSWIVCGRNRGRNWRSNQTFYACLEEVCECLASIRTQQMLPSFESFDRVRSLVKCHTVVFHHWARSISEEPQ